MLEFGLGFRASGQNEKGVEMITYQCPHCGKTLQIPEEYAGKSGKCNHCGQPITVPRNSFDFEEPIAPTPPPMPAVNTPQIADAQPSKQTTPQRTDLASKIGNLGLGMIGCGCLILALPVVAVVGIVFMGAVGVATDPNVGTQPTPSQPVNASPMPVTRQSTPRQTRRVEPQDKAAHEGITLAKFNKLTNGMSYRQVVAILGKEGTVMSTNTLPGINGNLTTTMYSWDAGFMASMTAMFQNDRLMSKSQLGLE